jgi:hypothetical protein
MSEYQYYEFLAIDRPLAEDETAALRALSTRAEITPVSFTNEYSRGDFKGDPDRLMQRYFDAHVYVANWMTAVFMVRLPIETLTIETAKALRVPGRWISRPQEPIDHYWCFRSLKTTTVSAWKTPGLMARLAPGAMNCFAGSAQPLHRMLAACREIVDDDEPEPLHLCGWEADRCRNALRCLSRWT